MDWHGHVLTDSGGYQIFSLEPKVDDDGATFRVDLRRQHRTTSRPRARSRSSGSLGADIQMVLDVCPPLPSPTAVVRTAVDRTAPWAARAKAALAPARADGLDPGAVRHRAGRRRPRRCARESAARTCEIGFDGYGIGGLSVGETRDEMLPALDADHRGAARRPAPVPDGRRRPGRASSRASPSASTCSTACCRPASPATARSSPTPAG